MIFPKRRPTRIPEFDYSSNYFYFITICTHEKRCIFGKPDQLNTFGKIAEECMNSIEMIYPGVKVDKFVIMPNHVHAIIQNDGMKSQSLIKIIGQYKMSVTKKIHQTVPDMEVWQRSFHDHIIRNQKSYEKIWQYIENNPIRWEKDCFFCKNQ